MAMFKSEKPLATAFFLSGIWNLAAASAYVVILGGIASQPLDRFNTLFIALLLFSFALLEILCSLNIRQYLIVVGCAAAGRVLYALLLFGSVIFVPGFPTDFWWTGAIDLGWAAAYLVLAAGSSTIRLRDLFIVTRAV